MQICGIIAEYNPFHHGHAKHIALSRAASGADLIVCALSGSFVQRGEPAVFDKWTRAACALRCGADAVVELPLLHAVQSAEGFAAGGVAVLDALGATDLCFGCETDDIDALTHIAKALAQETGTYKQRLKEHLGRGVSFPRARMQAAFPDAPEEACGPNAILGIEYIKAILQSGSAIAAHAVRRVGQGYHSTDIDSPLPSATAVRRALTSGNGEQAFAAMPPACADHVKSQLAAGLLPVAPDCFDAALLFALRLGGPEYIKTLHEVSEGLENRIWEASKTCTTRQALIAAVKTKRYTYTRISRILLYALLGITRKMVAAHNRAPIGHIRVLGVKTPDVLSALSRTARIPIVTGAACASCPDIDLMATRVWALTQTARPFCDPDRDFTQKLMITQP